MEADYEARYGHGWIEGLVIRMGPGGVKIVDAARLEMVELSCCECSIANYYKCIFIIIHMQ